MDIRGGYAKPKWTDVLWVQLFLLPITTCRWAYFYGRWLWKFGLCRQEYGEEEKLYVIRRNMGLSQLQFDVSACQGWPEMRRKWLSLLPFCLVTQTGQHTRGPSPSARAWQTRRRSLPFCPGRLGRLAGMDGEKNGSGSKKQHL